MSLVARRCPRSARSPYPNVILRQHAGAGTLDPEGIVPKAATICTVSPTEKGLWVVECQDGSFKASNHRSREEAIWYGRQHANECRPSILRILSPDRTVEAEYQYK
jgi:hypothetical protein